MSTGIPEGQVAALEVPSAASTGFGRINAVRAAP